MLKLFSFDRLLEQASDFSQTIDNLENNISDRFNEVIFYDSFWRVSLGVGRYSRMDGDANHNIRNISFWSFGLKISLSVPRNFSAFPNEKTVSLCLMMLSSVEKGLYISRAIGLNCFASFHKESRPHCMVLILASIKLIVSNDWNIFWSGQFLVVPLVKCHPVESWHILDQLYPWCPEA